MIDTHTHLYLSDFSNDIDEIMQKCQISGIHHLILPNIDKESVPQMNDLHSKYPAITSIAMGLHPTEVKEDWENIMTEMGKELESGKFVAIGEVGMDLYWDQTFANQQKQAFRHQLSLAEKYKLPVIIHCRNALTETLEAINEVKPTVTPIFHSFTGNKEDVRTIREVCDPFFGINGVITYKNARELREALPEIGIEKILLETDSPYLSPVPNRGKRNDSNNLKYIKDKIAEVLNIEPLKVEEITDLNAKSVFTL